MFGHFHSRSFAPAWAEAGLDNRFFAHGGGRGKPFGKRWGDESRTRRGDIKFILLELLSEQPRHGYELIKELEARHGGFRRLSPGSVYPTLQLLEDGGYLTSEPIEGKRIYTVTEMGRQLLSERNQQTRSGNPVDTYGNSAAGKPAELIELRQALTDLTDAVVLVARSGNLEQTNQVRERLIQLKREIYKMLADQ